MSVEEWASMWDDYSKDPDSALDWQNQYQRFMFDLEDASGDGSIDIEEFISVCSCYGLQTQECKEAFQKMAQVCNYQKAYLTVNINNYLRGLIYN